MKHQYRNPYSIQPENTTVVAVRPAPKPPAPDPVALARQLAALLPHLPDDTVAKVGEVLDDPRLPQNVRLADSTDDRESLEGEVGGLKDQIKDLRAHINKWENAYRSLPDSDHPADDPAGFRELCEPVLVRMAALYHTDI